MLTIMATLKVKPEYLSEYLLLAKELTRETFGKRKGCLAYSFLQQRDNPTQFVLYEQWDSQDTLNHHIQWLIEKLGPAKPDGFLPQKLMDMYQDGHVNYYRVME
ncbi:putative quinol monooxygenase [Vibrio viridaestus]|uniref:Antibiotic biosynthesis monooxygenase n=1 Tax=Vibrio viridaestus TaxID=2487322 RepID=A0A3N9TKJ0_9VIBR|nr:antibiotic biosynthesis monooxygenase family protein [Vibrio viridaestus]RQW64363.1 antibiotic biosynthesis monooxygenase [Vibrio viridaestus]